MLFFSPVVKDTIATRIVTNRARRDFFEAHFRIIGGRFLDTSSADSGKMCSPEDLRGLRGKNRELLTQLKDHGKILRSLSGTWSHNASPSRINQSVRTTVMLSKSQVVDTESNELDPITAVVPNNTSQDWKTSERLAPAERVLTLVGGHQGLARAALSRSQAHDPHETFASRPLTVSIRGDQDEPQDSVECCLPKPSVPDRDIGQYSFPGHSDLLMDEGNSRSSQARKSEMRSNPGPQTHQSEKGDVHMVALERCALEPLLGYDWIAGLLDVENSVTEHSEQFFLDLQNFRHVNRQECVDSRHTGAKEDELSSLSLSRERKPQHTMETHKCIFCYRINSRLFPTPLDFKAACPVCRMPKTQHPHTMAEPAFIRISIPHSSVVPAYHYRAHRRSSFDPSTSLGLPSHCLAGWYNTAPATKDQLSSLDLRSSLDKVLSDRCGA